MDGGTEREYERKWEIDVYAFPLHNVATGYLQIPELICCVYQYVVWRTYRSMEPNGECCCFCCHFSLLYFSILYNWYMYVYVIIYKYMPLRTFAYLLQTIPFTYIVHRTRAKKREFISLRCTHSRLCVSKMWMMAWHEIELRIKVSLRTSNGFLLWSS